MLHVPLGTVDSISSCLRDVVVDRFVNWVVIFTNKWHEYILHCLIFSNYSAIGILATTHFPKKIIESDKV